MQTFLPYPDFARSAAALDERRLGKQRVEVLQVLRALELEEYGWRNHPAVRMWQGCVPTLVTYGLACVERWTALGHGDTTAPLLREFLQRPAGGDLPGPPWLGWPALHRSHRLALYRKDPAIYGPRFPDVAGEPLHGEAPYVWPDAPAPARPLEPWSAWVVRPVADLDEAVVAVPAAPAGARPGSKPRRTAERFCTAVAVDDLVVEASPLAAGSDPGEQRLRVGRIIHGLAGGPARGLPRGPVQSGAGGMLHLRAVRWDGMLHRGQLRRPAQLQDPRPFFALRGEPLLDAWPAAASASAIAPSTPARSPSAGSTR